MSPYLLALPHYWQAGMYYATAGVMASASLLGWGIAARWLEPQMSLTVLSADSRVPPARW